MTIDQQSVSLDARDPDFVQNPYPFYAELRARCPVFHWKELGHWCFANHDDVNALLRAGQTAEALTVSCANVEQSEKLRGPSHPETSFARYQQGLALVNVGDLEAASVAFGQAAKDLRISVGPEHYLTLLNGYSVTAALWQLGREEEARAAGAEYFGSPPDPERVKASGKADDPVFEFLAESVVDDDAPRK